MSRLREWTSAEIEELKASFLKGEKIKIIAKHLGRTPTALNKALSRFGIRSSRKPEKIKVKSYVNWSEHKTRPIMTPDCFDHSRILLKDSSKEEDNPFYPRSSIQAVKERYHCQKDVEQWVSLDKIINYLERQGHRIAIKNAEQDSYEVDKKPATATCLLLLANRLRVEERKPIFMVYNLTW